jgi:membrane protein DedA with SNARE-associated domain
MTMLTIVSLLAGGVLAQRFRVFVLIPGTMILLVAAVGTGIVQAQSTWWIILTTAAVSASMQVGYAVGVATRHILDSPAPARPQGSSSGAPARHRLRKKPVRLSPTRG